MTNTPASPSAAAASAEASRTLRRVLLSCIVGTTIEWYDFFLYGTAAGIIFNKQYFPTKDPTVGTLLAFATFAIGFAARPVGGLIFGHIGDRLGRKRTLVMTMMIMGVGTLLIGCLPTYRQAGLLAPALLVLLRVAQGIAVGGEWGGAILMSVEYAPKGKRGLFGSVPQMGLALGLLMGTGVFALGQTVLSSTAFGQWGWRVGFWLSAILVAVGLVIRLKLVETPEFRKVEALSARSSIPAVELARGRRNRRNVLLGMGARWVEGTAYNAWAVFAISYSTNTLNMRSGPALYAVMISAAVLFVLIPLWGRIADRWTPRRTFALGAALSAVAPLVCFPMLASRRPILFGIGVIIALGLIYPIIYAPEGTFFAELFAARVRYTGISVVYQLSGIVASGLTPLLLTELLNGAHGGVSLIVIYFLVIGAISLVCTLAARPLGQPSEVSSPVDEARVSS